MLDRHDCSNVQLCGARAWPHGGVQHFSFAFLCELGRPPALGLLDSLRTEAGLGDSISPHFLQEGLSVPKILNTIALHEYIHAM